MMQRVSFALYHVFSELKLCANIGKLGNQNWDFKLLFKKKINKWVDLASLLLHPYWQKSVELPDCSGSAFTDPWYATVATTS